MYNIINFVLDHKNHLTLWQSGDVDCFLMQEGTLVYGTTLEELYAKVPDDCLIEKSVIHQYCDDLMINGIDCKNCLDFWNCISDLAACLFLPFSGDEENGIIQRVYRKLFYGCHFEEYPQGEPEEYLPWIQEESECLAKVIEEGKEMLKTQWKK